MTNPSNQTTTPLPPFKPSTAEEAAEAYRLAAELWRELKKEVQPKPMQDKKN